ncbi:hypothetical protein J8F10_24310 [Gemmata sp. G18]|uniref:Uncharacterized protein n=1 Tax=Gemmata palustris TaxID=2822762 RepID=A0ABS5BYR4_9BACT|nr:hypothetical protein [Gemmata palustris]MBP3958385.1 hypothetical protein [Gemmata palustris]
MSTWKVLVIGLFFVTCLALGLATIAVPLDMKGGERWAWLGGLFATTAFTTTLFILFLKYAERNMDAKASTVRY